MDPLFIFINKKILWKRNLHSLQIHQGQFRRPYLLDVLNRILCKKLCLILSGNSLGTGIPNRTKSNAANQKGNDTIS